MTGPRLTSAHGRASLVLAVAITVAGCREPSVTDCASHLGGVWANPSGEAFHVTDDGALVEIFALAGDGWPALSDASSFRSAGYVRLERSGDGLVGFFQQFLGLGNSVCRVRTAARIAPGCRADALLLTVGVAGTLDPRSCAQAPDQGEKRIELSRRRRLP